MADNFSNTITAANQPPIECQTPSYRVSRAIEALEKATNKAELDRAWTRTGPLREFLADLYDNGDQEAWQQAKRLHRALYASQFLNGSS